MDNKRDNNMTFVSSPNTIMPEPVGQCLSCNRPVYAHRGKCVCGNHYDLLLSGEQVNRDKTLVPAKEKDSLETSDGSTAGYYDFPPDLKQLQDLISYLNCNAQMGEIGRAWMRYGRCGHSERRRDLRKILFYANAELDRLDTYEPELGQDVHD